MTGTTRVTYIGPMVAVEIAETGQVVKHGETVAVPDDLAGHAPVPGRPAVGEPDSDDYEPAVPDDPGAGLLAQRDVWAGPRTADAQQAKQQQPDDAVVVPVSPADPASEEPQP